MNEQSCSTRHSQEVRNQEAIGLKEAGNELFRERRVEEAAEKYQEALQRALAAADHLPAALMQNIAAAVLKDTDYAKHALIHAGATHTLVSQRITIPVPDMALLFQLHNCRELGFHCRDFNYDGASAVLLWVRGTIEQYDAVVHVYSTVELVSPAVIMTFKRYRIASESVGSS